MYVQERRYPLIPEAETACQMCVCVGGGGGGGGLGVHKVYHIIHLASQSI